MSKLIENTAKITQILADIEQLPEDRYEIGKEEGLKVAAKIIDRSITELTEEDLQGVTEIGDYAFDYCKKLQTVRIPEGVTKIGQYSFAYCESLTSIFFPPLFQSLNTYAFRFCKKLETVCFGENCQIKVMSNYLFSDCTSLKQITIPESVTSFAVASFSKCTALEAITMPLNVFEINSNAFQGCSNLSVVTMQPTTPPKIQSNTFSGCTALSKIIVPIGTADTYKAATNWSQYADIIVEEV